MVAFSGLPWLSMDATDALRLRPLTELLDSAGLAAAMEAAAALACMSKASANCTNQRLTTTL